MTTVTFLTEEARIVGFDAQGHSGYAAEGEDLVCAAVTSAVRLAECAVNDVLGLEADAADVLVPSGGGADCFGLAPGSALAAAYGRREIEAQGAGAFGMSGLYRAQMEQAGLRVTATDPRGEMAAAELLRHKFYVGALFLPAPAPDPLLRAFCAAAQELARTRPDGME